MAPGLGVRGTTGAAFQGLFLLLRPKVIAAPVEPGDEGGVSS